MSPRRMLTKNELLRLQKLYRTDKRIAEALGGNVTEQLVAYWRRKKGVSKYNFPKFSDKEVQEVWDRFGDDFHAGLELGISKAAFYNWRRRYKINKKPEALKLEQLSLELFTPDHRSRQRQGTGRQTAIQKILCKLSGEKSLQVGQPVEIEPDIVLIGRLTGLIVDNFSHSGTTYVWNFGRIAITCDDLETGGQALPLGEVIRIIRDFARVQQINQVYGPGHGCFAQAVVEDGLVMPGQLCLCSDNRLNAVGAVGCVPLIVNADSIGRVLRSGKLAVNAPETVRVYLSGRLPRGALAIDAGQQIVSQIKRNGVQGKMIEIYGSAIDYLSIADRMALCSLLSLTGAVGVISPYNATVRRYVNPRAARPYTPVFADRNAEYEREYTFDINTIKPNVVTGPKYDCARPIDDLLSIPVRAVYIGGLAGGRFEDLKIASEILKGKKLPGDVQLFVQPGTKLIYHEALRKGLIRAFAEIGAVVLHPGLDGREIYRRVLAAGEKAMSTDCFGAVETEGNDTFYVSPATAAVSALNGRVTNPTEYIKL